MLRRDDFIADKMTCYLAGGASAETAAQSTRGELLAIYRRQHHSRDESGAWQITPPPENIYIPAAMKKADEAIAEILRDIKAEASYSMAHNATDKREPSGIALGAAQGAKKRSGLEGLKKYIGETA